MIPIIHIMSKSESSVTLFYELLAAYNGTKCHSSTLSSISFNAKSSVLFAQKWNPLYLEQPADAFWPLKCIRTMLSGSAGRFAAGGTRSYDATRTFRSACGICRRSLHCELVSSLIEGRANWKINCVYECTDITMISKLYIREVLKSWNNIGKESARVNNPIILRDRMSI